MNIKFQDINGISNGIYNKTSAIGIPLTLSLGQTTVNVTVCHVNDTSCHSVIAGL